jgi:hypothetical protein
MLDSIPVAQGAMEGMQMSDDHARGSVKGRISDDPSVREVFADEFVGFFVRGSNFHLTFAATRQTVEDSTKHFRKVTARLVISLQTAMDVYGTLGNALSVLEKQNVVKRPVPLP